MLFLNISYLYIYILTGAVNENWNKIKKNFQLKY